MLGIDLAGEGVPAALLVEGEIVRLAEQQRELDGFVLAQGLDRGAERNPGIAPSAAILAGRNPADAADGNLASVPNGGAEVDADMACKICRPARASDSSGASISTRRSAWAHLTSFQDSSAITWSGQTASISGLTRGHDASPFSTSISMLIFCPVASVSVIRRTRTIVTEEGARFVKLRCLSAMEPSIRFPVRPRLPSFSDITP